MDDRLATCWFQPLTQLNIWLRRKDLNPRPSGYEPDELPSCYHPAIYKMVASTGIEPVLQEFSVLCSTYWAMRPYNTNEKWWAEQDLNLQCIWRHGFTVRLLHQFAYLPKIFGTDNRNRTHINGFGDHCSTFELYLHLMVLSMRFEPICQKHCRLRTACLPISPQEH